MVYHVLNGDALVDRFVATGILGEMLVARECLVEGPLDGETPGEFFNTRAKYLFPENASDRAGYFSSVANEFEKLIHAGDGSEFNLWFGYDLFCQANMWFILSLLHDMNIRKEIFVVYPSHLSPEDRWRDFGGASLADLQKCFTQRINVNETDSRLGKDLWVAFKKNDLTTLEKLAATSSNSFPYLQEVCTAHLQRFPVHGEKGRPERAVEEAITITGGDFTSVFREFTKQEGVYGFGDTQVKYFYDKIRTGS